MCSERSPAPCTGLSSEEVAALESGQSSAAGVGALVVAAGAGALTAATAAAALSCEALQAQVPLSAPC
jgi:histidine ammonia-lyase